MVNRNITVLLVDDHELVRIGLETSLAKVPDIKVIGSVADGKTAVTRALEAKPDVVLMDIGMPVLDGIEAARQIKEKAPNVRILMLTSYEKERDVIAAFLAGADGYCLKGTSTENLLNAVRSVHQGAAWLDPGVADAVLRNYPLRSKQSDKRSESRLVLSQREQEVLSLLVEGLSNTQIAEKLSLSPETVKTHVRHIMEKLSVSDRTQAAVKALREGLLDY